MTMRIYTSLDASAPTLQGIVGGAYSSGWADGSLLNLLDKVLVTGYGSQTAAGWTRSFTGTSQGTFRQGAGCLFYLNVLDDGSLTAGAREGAFWGSETASAVLTGTGLFPTVAQQATGLKMRKSDTADTTQRSWIVFADNKTFYLFVNTGFSTAYYAAMGFGDFFSYKSGDLFNCMAVGRITSAIVDATANEQLDAIRTGAYAATNGHYIARGYAGTGTSVQWDGRSMSAISNATTGSIVFPNPTDSGFYVGRLYIIDLSSPPTTSVRGYLRGLWFSQNTGASLPLEYNFAGVGTLAGRTFRVLGLGGGQSPTTSRFVMETSDTWD